MLQQTRTETALRYFDPFIARFPDLFTLAQAPQHDVLKAWEGLGYYSRAGYLHKGAAEVIHTWGGVLPNTVSELQTIPGIGPYTAAAIASIAYEHAEPVVDSNGGLTH